MREVAMMMFCSGPTVQSSSDHFSLRWYLCPWRNPCTPPPISQMFPRHCLCNSLGPKNEYWHLIIFLSVFCMTATVTTSPTTFSTTCPRCCSPPRVPSHPLMPAASRSWSSSSAAWKKTAWRAAHQKKRKTSASLTLSPRSLPCPPLWSTGSWQTKTALVCTRLALAFSGWFWF